MTEPQPMETAPKDREILVWAQWDWSGMYGDGADGAFAWRVAQWQDDGFWSVTDNPYSDRAVRPMGWVDLPPALQVPENNVATAPFQHFPTPLTD